MSDESSNNSPPRGNKRRSRVLSSSDSSDDSDVPIRRRKINRRALSAMSDSDSSDDDALPLSNLRTGPRLVNDEENSVSDWNAPNAHSDLEDSSEDKSDNGSTRGSFSSRNVPSMSGSPKKDSSPPSPKMSGNQSDISEGNSDKCPICLLSFSNQNIGTPENCEHLFCADCITEWSKNVNTCPVDRLTFNMILVRRMIGGKIIKKIPVSPRRPSEEEFFIEDTTFCEVCSLSTSEETMLLCDSCDRGYHMHCLTPPLNEVPEDEWFCPHCAQSSMLELEHYYEEDEEENFLYGSGSHGNLALLPRTLSSSRTALRNARNSRNASQGDSSLPSTSGSTSVGRQRSSNTSSRRRTTASGRRRRRRRTRNVVVEYEMREGGKFPIKVKKKKIGRRKRRRAPKRAPRTAARRAMVRQKVRGRLLEHQGLNGSIQPSGILARQLAIPQLSVYGNRNELDYFPESEEEDIEIDIGRGGAAVAIAPRSVASAILDSHRQIRRKMISIPSPTYASSAPDLLSSILESQTRLHSKISINPSSKNDTAKNDIPKISHKSNQKDISKPDENKKIDVRNEDANGNIKKVPGYPGSGHRGSGNNSNWRGGQGYQGQGGGNRGNSYSHSQSAGDYSSSGGGFQGDNSTFQGNRSFQGNNNPWQSNCGSDMFQRREQLDFSDRSPVQRGGLNSNRGRGAQFRYGPQISQRSLPSSPWQNQPIPELSRSFNSQMPNAFPPFPDMSNPVDMTTGNDINNYNMPARPSPLQDTTTYHTAPAIPLSASFPQPPIIRFQKPPLSEDERSDTSQHEEADKYDPTEPTLDDSSSEEDTTPRPIIHNKITIVSPPRKETSLVAEYGSGSDSPGILQVSSNILDQAVQQVIMEHKELIMNQNKCSRSESQDDAQDECPNFSIYSTVDLPKGIQAIQNNLEEPVEEREEDLVQEDDVESIDGTKVNENTDLDMIPIPQDGSDNMGSKENSGTDYNNDWYDDKENENQSETQNVCNDEKSESNDNLSNNNDMDNVDNLSEKNFELLNEKCDAPQNQDSLKNDNNVDYKEPDKLECEDSLSETLNKSTEDLSVEKNVETENADTCKDDPMDKTEIIDDCLDNKISGNLNNNSTPQKRTPITIRLLPHRSMSKNKLDLYDKEDYADISAELNETKSGEATSHTKNKTNDDDTQNNIDEDICKKKSSTSELLPADIEKLTECISDAEDERSYTPCLDENKSNKSKDTTFESEKENTGIGGLDTEMISEDEGNEIFSDHNNPKNDSDGGALELSVRDTELQPGDFEEGEIVEKRKQKIKEKVKALLKPQENKTLEEDKKKKKKKGEKDIKDKSKAKTKKSTEDSSFKKLSKSGKERNYRDRDDKMKTKNKEKRLSKSPDKEKKDKIREKKKEKRKDIERYDVRNIISDKSRRVKDAFGRDTSRPRSKSPDSHAGSPLRFRRSVSRRRSLSRNRKSLSRNRNSVSKIRRSRSRQSFSRKKRSVSKGPRSLSRRRSISRTRKSLSRNGKTISPPPRKSISPRFKRSVSPRFHKARSPKRRSLSSRGRMTAIRGRRSISPRLRRSKSPRIRKSPFRMKGKRNKRSFSRGRRLSPRPHREMSPRRRPIRRSRSRGRSVSKNRSMSPKIRKSRKLKRNRSNSSKRKFSKSPHKPKLKRKRSRSYSPGVVLSRSPSMNRENVQRHWVTDKSPMYQEWSSASRSLSPVRVSPGWTPPPQRHKSPQQDNLRVILTTKDKSKKKEKKKKNNKRNKAAERILQHQPKDTGPSKEVFTSGNNILVSVSFNKNQESQEISTMPPPDEAPKKKKHKNDAVAKTKKDKGKEKGKKKRGDKSKKSKDIENKKPVAIIDLDKSPFKELTPSPKAVIILSDSENGEKEEELMERQEMLRGELMEMGFPQSDDVESPRRSPVRDNTFVPTVGPKTPPEPVIKFTISNKGNAQLRTVNPLHDEEEDELPSGEVTEEKQENEKRVAEMPHKGPNTPPDPPNSPPSSPDAYDPFEPTKSGSATPERPLSPQPEKHSEKRSEELLQVPSMSLEAAQKSNLSADDVIQARPISPMEKVLALLKSTRNNLSPANTSQPLYSDQIYDSNKSADMDNMAAPNTTAQSPERASASTGPTVSKTQAVYSAVVKPSSPKPIYSTVTPTVVTSSVYLNPSVPRIGVYTTSTPPSNQRIMLPSPTKSSPLKTQTSKLFMAKPSPIKSTPIKPMPSKTIISKLPMPTIKPLPTRNQKITKGKNGQNGSEVIDLDLDMDSPYSPGSSDFGDLFEPPADNGKHTNTTYSQNKQSKFDVFDSLFGMKITSKNLAKSSSLTKVPVRQTKKSKGKTQVGVRMDEDSLRILDDLPSSAVEMQVKTKFLKKLNRQERVVEEVKLVLKPHYNKKHISKEDYKEIMRRAVPKICHNRTGEINPAKIHALIEAYVRKFRKKAHKI